MENKKRWGQDEQGASAQGSRKPLLLRNSSTEIGASDDIMGVASSN
jgi:hypothetical protein